MKAQQIGSYISHWLNKVDEHSIHSPFFFDFYKNVIKATRKTDGLPEIEKLRDSLLTNLTEIKLEELGAGSHQPVRTIADIAKNSLSPARLSALYLQMLKHFQATNVVELGTSMGLNTLYLAHEPDTRVTTFEGRKSMVDIALTHFEMFEKKNIKVIEGNIDQTLPKHLQTPDKIHFALVDANHRYEPTLRYFNQLVRRMTEKSILVLDDIHWSGEMEKAWKEISRHELVYGSIDLYRCGILFFDPALNKQHFILSL